MSTAGGISFADSAVDSELDVTINGGSGLHGDVTVINSNTASLYVNDSQLVGDLDASDDSVLTVVLDNSTYEGVSLISDSAVINLTLSNGSNWNLTGQSRLTTLTSDNGSITIDNVQGEDLTVSDGISGQTSLNLTLSDGVRGQEKIHVVVDETGTMSSDAFSLGREVSAGMYQYTLENDGDGAWLVYTGNSGTSILSSEADAALNSAAGVSSFWFTQLNNLNKRMGELRLNDGGRGEGRESLLENAWVRAYGQQST
jgi:outer membrane autotransporter protein